MFLDRQAGLTDEILGPAFLKGAGKIIFMSSLFLTPDYLKQKGSLVSAFSRTAYALGHFKEIESFTESVNRIDDIIDSMQGAEVMELGNVSYGTELCPFLKNPKLDPDDYLAKIERLVSLGLTDRGTAIAFSNMFACKLYERAKLEPLARNSNSTGTRIEMAELNISVTQLYSAFIFRCFNKYKNTYEDAENLTPHTALAPYPNVTRLAFLGQVLDDMRDFFIDIKSEMDTQVASSNMIMAQMARDRHLSNSDGKLKAELRSFVTWGNTRPAIPLDEAPPSVQHAMQSIVRRFHAASSWIDGIAARKIIESCMYGTLSEGMRTPSHPHLREEEEKQKRLLPPRVETAQMGVK